MLVEERGAHRLAPLGRRRRHRPANRVGQARGVDVKVRISLRGDALEGEEGANQEHDVRRGEKLVRAAHGAQTRGERAEPALPALLSRQRLVDRRRHLLRRHRHEFLELFPRDDFFSVKVIRRAHSHVPEDVREADPVPGDHALDPLGEPLHDVILDGGHQTKVEEDEAPVLLVQQQVTLVGIGVDEPRVRELRDAGFDRHLRHHEPLLRGQLRYLLPVDPLGGEHLRGAGCAGELRVPLGRPHESEPLVLRVELVHVPRLVDVIQLLEDPHAHLVGDLRQVGLAPPRSLQGAEAQRPHGPVQRHLSHHARALHLDRHLDPVPRDRLVHLPQRRGGDRAVRELFKQRPRVRVFARRLRRVVRRERAVELKILRDGPPRDFIRERSVLHLQRLERIRRLLAYEIRPLRQRLADLDEDGAEAAERRPELLAPRALLGGQRVLPPPEPD